MARRSSQPRELVRLSPLQFSLSVSIVVILMGGIGLAGYYYGMRQAARLSENAVVGPAEGLHEDAASKPETGDTEASVTFYSALTEPRKDAPAAAPPKAVRKPEPLVEPLSPKSPAPVPEIRNAGIVTSTVMLQVASYKDRVNAGKLLHDLSSEGYAGTVVRADLDERGIWFRVQIGPYTAGKETEFVLKKLRDERKLKGYIVK